MIIKEFFKQRKDGVNLYRTYSNQNLKIKQIETGNIYDEAIDVEDTSFNYEETDILIEEEKEG